MRAPLRVRPRRPLKASTARALNRGLAGSRCCRSYRPAYTHRACRGSTAPGVRCVGAVAGRTPSAPWMDSRGLGKAASSAAFLAGGAWPSPEPLPPCQPSSGWLLILDVVCRQRGLQPAPLLGPQREVGVRRSRSAHSRPRSEAAAWGTRALSSGTIRGSSHERRAIAKAEQLLVDLW